MTKSLTPRKTIRHTLLFKSERESDGKEHIRLFLNNEEIFSKSAERITARKNKEAKVENLIQHIIDYIVTLEFRDFNKKWHEEV